MQKKNISFNEVYDRFAIRIIYESSRKDEKFIAWKIYSIISDHFTPNPARFKDWITYPKVNGYEALHLTVVGPENRWVEIQIRSERMDEIAEKGYAAHYNYKHGETKEQEVDIWLNKLQDVLIDEKYESMVEVLPVDSLDEVLQHALVGAEEKVSLVERLANVIDTISSVPDSQPSA